MTRSDQPTEQHTAAHLLDQDLLAAHDQMASEAVLEHLQSCPECRARATALAALEQQLHQRLYRSICPNVDTLVTYHQGGLPTAQRVAMKEHLQICPHCRRELRMLTRLFTPLQSLPR